MASRLLPARPIGAVLIALSFSSVAPSVFAKCGTDRIDVSGAALHETIMISDADVAGRFFVYGGNFIRWPSGAVDDLPGSGETFAVSFLCAYGDGEPEVIYEIDYRFGIGDAGGYIFLPGAGDGRYYRNVSTILYDVEGSWFHATDEWERTIRPIIENAMRKRVAVLPED